ncbi:hypothetical protein MUN77_09495 [Leucobacter allii]|uniref:hypothetical protein n=1 Tax=Leucobacter allii TaxID=2932247 RepID=UPI001FD109E3|nr:hypothetical protein [Leucobacter allii]UOR00406.1 hypothetical protein MUN77_09495 [Leucobacter allii]
MPADAHASLADYLAPLPAESRELHTALVAAVGERAASAPRVHALLFVPGRAHPHFEDSEAVFWHAAQQLMLDVDPAEGELPVAWIGYDVASRFSGKREAQGFLITDRRLVVKDQVDGIFGTAAPRQYPLFTGPAGAAAAAAEITESSTAAYDWTFASDLVDTETAQSMTALLAELLVTVLETLARRRIALAPAPETSASLRGRVRELGLDNDVKYPEDAKHAKHFVKLAKKIPCDAGERVLLAVTGSTLMGVYGLVLTDRGVRSKDLGSDPVVTPRERISPEAIRIDPEQPQRVILGPGEVHELPASLDERRAAGLVTLLREWSAGRLTDEVR